MLYSEIVIAGCGNPLFADDGFGPAVIEEMQNLSLPDNVTIIDAGLGGPHFIFTMLDPEVTKKLVIIDIADSYHHPVTASLADFGNWSGFYRSDSLDLINIHPYPVTGKLDRAIITGVHSMLAKYGKPVLIGESARTATVMYSLNSSDIGVKSLQVSGLVPTSLLVSSVNGAMDT